MGPTIKQPRVQRPRFTSRVAALSRYTFGLLGVLLLAALVRMPLIWAAPLDTPSAPQATWAAYVRRLAQTGGDIKGSIPWSGPLPVDVTAGLPLYGWMAALVSGLLGPQPWIGRGLTWLAALAATTCLFVVVRRLAGGRAALYACLFLTLAPPGLYYGRAFLPDALGWALVTGALAACLRWRDTVLAQRPHEGRWFSVAAAMAGLAVLVSPANLAIVLPLLYLVRPRPLRPIDRASVLAAPASWTRSPVVFAGLVLAPLLLWTLLTQIAGSRVNLDPAYGGGGPAAVAAALRDGRLYAGLAGRLVNGTLTFAGFLLLLAGLGRPARQPWPWVIHLWALGGLVMLLANGPRLLTDDSAIAAWLPALAALTGIGANWIATLPAGIVAALRGHEEDLALLDADSTDGTPNDESARPTAVPDGARPARGAVRRSGWVPSTSTKPGTAWPQTRNRLLRLGNAGTILLMLAVFVGGWTSLAQRFSVGVDSAFYAAAGERIATSGPANRTSRVVVAGPGAPEIFYTSNVPGWALPARDFDRQAVDRLKAEGATLLVSADPVWLGHHPDYQGLLVRFQPFLFNTPPPGVVIFDLLNAPTGVDRRYFLETGHTLRGSFRQYWENHGGVATLGFPLTEEMEETNPDDGQKRTVQYFQRAILEYHPDKQGTAYDVQLAPLGRWLVQAKQRDDDAHGVPHLVPVDAVAPVQDTPVLHFVPQTGHTIRGEFLKAWQARGGVPIFGYPISEQFNDVSTADGKVHIMQYFQRARLEWHEEVQGSMQDKVQLGLVGAEWLTLAHR